MPITRQGLVNEEIFSDDIINKMCTKLTAMLTPTFETAINNKCATILESVKESVKDSVKEIKDLVIANCDRLDTADIKLDQLEQYSRRNNLRVYGIDETDGENTDEVLLHFFNNKLKVPLTLREIDRSHRTGKTIGDKPRSIIVKFTSYRWRSQIFNQKKLPKATKFVIKEDLTKYRAGVLQEAIKTFRRSNVWTHDGRIVIKHAGKTHAVTSVKEFPAV